MRKTEEDEVTLVMRPGQQSPVRQAGPDDDERYCLIRHPALHNAGRTLFMPLRSEHTNAHVDTDYTYTDINKHKNTHTQHVVCTLTIENTAWEITECSMHKLHILHVSIPNECDNSHHTKPMTLPRL